MLIYILSHRRTIRHHMAANRYSSVRAAQGIPYTDADDEQYRSNNKGVSFHNCMSITNNFIIRYYTLQLALLLPCGATAAATREKPDALEYSFPSTSCGDTP